MDNLTPGCVELAMPREHRTARLEVRSCTLELRGPPRPGGRLENHTLNLVWVRELNAPQGSHPLHWVLLTDLPVETLDQCRRVIQIYCGRWLIEEWHKALKTGLKGTQPTLRCPSAGGFDRHPLGRVRLPGAPELLARADPEAPLDPQHTDPAMLAVLRKTHPPHGRPTRRWFWIAIAKLGGFLARQGDGDPGWLTLWRGWQTLMILVRGYELANTS